MKLHILGIRKISFGITSQVLLSPFFFFSFHLIRYSKYGDLSPQSDKIWVSLCCVGKLALKNSEATYIWPSKQIRPFILPGFTSHLVWTV